MKLALLVAAIAACGPSRPQPANPAPASARAGSAVAEQPAYDVARWRAIKERKGAVDGDARALIPELVSLLGSTDPAIRDGLGYEVAVMWIAPDGPLGAEGVRALAARLRAELRVGLPATGESDATFKRSFAALVLSAIAWRDTKSPVLSDAELAALLDDAVWYAAHEVDLRGHTGAKGWCHAAAHTGDLLEFLARNPRIRGDDAARILDAIAELVDRRHGYIMHHGEELRLSAPVIELLQRDAITTEQFAGWLQIIAAPINVQSKQFEPKLYAAQRNATSLLMALLTRFAMIPDPPPSIAAANRALVALLRS